VLKSPVLIASQRPRSRASKLMPGRKLLRHTTTTVFSALDVAYWALFEVDSF
jgi:hypothetical protein